MKKLTSLKVACMVFVFCAATAVVSQGQVTFTTLVNFDGSNGSLPDGVLTQGADGNFYGVTDDGGNGPCGVGCGTFFKMTPAGTLTTLYNFCSQTNCTDGAYPGGSLVQAANSDFYGTTSGGGTYGWGTVFKITPAGTLTTLYSFCALSNCADGEEPEGLVQGANGNFYGTTLGGGITGCNNIFDSCGTVFEITAAGKLTTLYSFCALNGCPDGDLPNGELLQVSNGYFYGETAVGGGTGNGGAGCGTIFKISPQGKLTTLLSFEFGCAPNGGLIQAANGDFYGVTVGGGSGEDCDLNEGCGTVFEISSMGELTTLYNFCTSACTGAEPVGPLVQGANGNFYGVTYGYPEGTAFEMTPKGRLTTGFTFGGNYGSLPEAGLLQATNGLFYGTTAEGGPGGKGTIFSISAGLGPFVKTQPTFAKEGTTIGIFGQGFTSSSVVQFGGVQGTVVKVSGTFLEAKVPAGALTGSVTVTTNGTTLTTNQPFRVTPQLLSFSPPNGPVGTQVTINGVGFTQTTGVGFGDKIPAQFTVNSDTQITATVPSGAKTGPVGVVTEGGIAVSSGTFTVN
jgi:uncharacterized repeat protein (TIGR03803 family)